MNETYVGEMPPPAPRPPVARQWWRRLCALGLLAVALLTGLHFYQLYRLDQQMAAAIAEADRLDPGWQWEDLEARRAAVPDAQNAALTVQAVGRLLPGNWPTPTPPNAPPGQYLPNKLLNLPPNQQLSAELVEVLRTELAKIEPALAAARPLRDQPTGRYTLVITPDFVSTLLTPMQDVRKLACVLLLYADLLAQDGQADEALAAGRAVLNAGRSVGDEAMLIPQLIRFYCLGQAICSIERTLAQGEPSAPQLQATQAALEQEDRALPAVLLQATRGERAGMHKAMQALEAGNIKVSQLLAMMGDSSILPSELLDLLPITGVVKQAHARILRILTELVEIAKLPLAEQTPRLKQLNQELTEMKTEAAGRKDLTIVSLMLVAIDKPFESARRIHALLRSTAVSLAAERFRQAQGRWPNTLAELCPTYLQKVPTDPYDGQPLRYRRLPDGVVIYAVGPDGKDDGGNLQRNKMPQERGTDQGFQLWDVEQRRQPTADVVPPDQALDR